MTRTIKYSLLLATCAVAALGMFTQPSAAEMSKGDIEKIVAEYIKANPEILLDSLENYRVSQEEKAKMEISKRITDNLPALTDESSPFIGNKDGDVTVIEFFDYNCGYCKRALPDIRRLVENDKNVRVIFKEMPILSPGSTLAAKWALAAHNQGKYFEFHSALMDFRGDKTIDELSRISKELGLDVKKMAEDAESDKIKAKLEKDTELARQIGVQGTPAFIINGKFYPGYMGSAGLEDSITQARKNKK